MLVILEFTGIIFTQATFANARTMINNRGGRHISRVGSLERGQQAPSPPARVSGGAL